MIQTVKKNGIPLIYVISICGTILALYIQNLIIWILLEIIVLCLLFCFLHFIKEAPTRMGTVFYLITALLMVFLVSWFLNISDTSWDQYTEILLSGIMISKPALGFAVFIPVCFIFGSLVFYCSNVMYSSFLNFLLAVIPFLLYLKAMRPFSAVYMITQCFLYFLIMLHCRQRKLGRDTQYIASAKFKWYVFIMLAIVILPVSLIPKSTVAPFRSYLNQLTGLGFSPSSKEMLGMGNGVSGNSYGSDTIDKEELLFYMEGDYSKYLKSVSFVQYDWTNHGWRLKNSEKEKHYSPENLSSFYSVIGEAFQKKPELKARYPTINPDSLAEVDTTTQTLTIIPQDFPIRTVFYPPNTVSTKTDPAQYNISWMLNDTLLSKPVFNGKSYSTEYLVNKGLKWPELEAQFGGFDSTEYVQFLHDLGDEGAPILEEYEYAVSIPKEMKYATYIKNLAHEITMDCETDYEKAKALENYFHKGDFTYDASYIPPEAGPIYFLKESKTGACADYATAMTLMAMSIDLPAKYTEGFQITEADETNDRYIARVKNSHAFVEIYIKGAGWTLFEPTVSLSAEYEYTPASSPQWWQLMDFSTMIIWGSVLSFSLCLIMILIPLFKEAGFRMRILMSSKETTVKLVYYRLWEKMKRIYGIEAVLGTSDFVQLIQMECNYDASETAAAFYQLMYGNKGISSHAKRRAIKSYMLVSRKLPRKRKVDLDGEKLLCLPDTYIKNI